METHYKWLAVASLMASLVACSTPPSQPTNASPTTVRSGFLQDYSHLVQDPHDADYQHYVAPSFVQRYPGGR